MNVASRVSWNESMHKMTDKTESMPLQETLACQTELGHGQEGRIVCLKQGLGGGGSLAIW